jgi:hypothetical protein
MDSFLVWKGLDEAAVDDGRGVAAAIVKARDSDRRSQRQRPVLNPRPFLQFNFVLPIPSLCLPAVLSWLVVFT